MLDIMPKSCIPEIQEMILEIHSKIKSGSIPEFGSGNFFDLYGGHLSALRGRLGVGLVVLEIPISNVQPRNPYEHPITGFELQMKQIEELWLIGDRTRKAKAEAEAEAEAKARKAEAEKQEYVLQEKNARKWWCNYKQELLLSAEDMDVKYSILHEHIRKLYNLNSKKLDVQERIQYNLKRYSIKCDNVLKGLSALTNELKTRTWDKDHKYDKGLGELSQIVTDCFKWYKVMDEYVQYWSIK